MHVFQRQKKIITKSLYIYMKNEINLKQQQKSKTRKTNRSIKIFVTNIINWNSKDKHCSFSSRVYLSSQQLLFYSFYRAHSSFSFYSINQKAKQKRKIHKNNEKSYFKLKVIIQHKKRKKEIVFNNNKKKRSRIIYFLGLKIVFICIK